MDMLGFRPVPVTTFRIASVVSALHKHIDSVEE